MEENEVFVLLALHVLADGTDREKTRNPVGASGSLRKSLLLDTLFPVSFESSVIKTPNKQKRV